MTSSDYQSTRGKKRFTPKDHFKSNVSFLHLTPRDFSSGEERWRTKEKGGRSSKGERLKWLRGSLGSGHRVEKRSQCWWNNNLGGGFKYFLFSPRNMGKMKPILTYALLVDMWLNQVTVATITTYLRAFKWLSKGVDWMIDSNEKPTKKWGFFDLKVKASIRFRLSQR